VIKSRPVFRKTQPIPWPFSPPSCQAVPHLKETVEAQIVRLAEDAAAIPDQLIPRPLKAKDKVAIAEHRKMQDTTRQRLSEDLVYAMIGRASGPIFTSLIAARDEALERAGAASLNTNPGGVVVARNAAHYDHATAKHQHHARLEVVDVLQYL
jgi:hypothetical protein